VCASIITLPSRSAGADVRRQQLQREGDLIEDQLRDRDHQDQERDREQHHPQPRPSADEQDGAGDGADERDPGQEELGAEAANREQRQTAEHHDQAQPRRSGRRPAERRPALPGEIEG
jgi:hypothetical protein